MKIILFLTLLTYVYSIEQESVIMDNIDYNSKEAYGSFVNYEIYNKSIDYHNCLGEYNYIIRKPIYKHSIIVGYFRKCCSKTLITCRYIPIQCILNYRRNYNSKSDLCI